MGKFSERMAKVDIPDNVDNRGFADPPTGKWFLVQTAPEESGAHWQATGYAARGGLKIIGAEESVKRTDGPFGSLFWQIFYSDYDREAGRSLPDVINPVLIGAANALLSPGLPKNSDARWDNTTKIIDEACEDLDLDEIPTEPMVFGAGLVAALKKAPRTLLVKTRLETPKPYTNRNGQEVKPQPRAGVGDFEDATPENITKRKVVVW